MFGTQNELICALRSLALRGGSPSEMLRTILSQSHSGAIDLNSLVQYFSEAFCFSDGQAFPIFGWLPDGTGSLKDSEIDYLMTRRIQQTRAEWENLG
jgi:hypothetical protein